jgi:hypothetical protein
MFRKLQIALAPVMGLLAIILIIQACTKEQVYPSQILPIIKSVNPSGAMVGDNIMILGANLATTSKVRFGTVLATGFTANDTSISVRVPAGLAPGEVQVQVSLKDSLGYAGAPFVVIETPRAPSITRVTPNRAYPGVSVEISGADMINVTEVLFGTQKAVFEASMNKIVTTVPANAAGGLQKITITNPVGPASVDFTVDLGPEVTGLNPSSAKVGEEVTLTGRRFTDATRVSVGVVNTIFTVVNASTIRFTVPNGATTNPITVVTPLGTITSTAALDVKGDALVLEPVADPNLVFFNFDGRDSWWGDVKIEKETELALAGNGNYGRINSGSGSFSGWTAFCFRNGRDQFPGAVIGTNVSDYVFKFDVYVIDPITGGEFAFRLQGDDGDFFYNWKPWAGTGSFRTFGWRTITVQLNEFLDGAKTITDMGKNGKEFGLAFNNGTSRVNVAIDNIRFEKK